MISLIRHVGLLSSVRYSLLAMVLLGLSGCMSGPAGGLSNGSRDIMTASDEPEARKRARIRLELALGYFEQGQTTVALDELKQSLVADPAYAPAHNLRGLIYMRLNDFRIADDSFSRALALNPGDANVLHNLAWLQCQQRRWSESFRNFDQALADPQYGERAKTYRALGLCQARAGLAADAEVGEEGSVLVHGVYDVFAYSDRHLLEGHRQEVEALLGVLCEAGRDHLANHLSGAAHVDLEPVRER